jgi:tRNA pseudouridine38-40 synthase
MRNIRLTLAYDGSHYVGWQIQPNGTSVQAAVAAAVEKLTGEKPVLLAAGRTDSGVHALGQVANFQTQSEIPCAKMQAGLQHFLPRDIAVVEVAEVPLDFHATYSAKSKHYRYVIYESAIPNPFVRPYAWQLAGPLDAVAMDRAASLLLGTHDFRCFESHFPNKATSVRTVTTAQVTRQPGWAAWTDEQAQSAGKAAAGEHEGCGTFIWFDIVADGFLYNMVRAITGTLVKVGEGQWQPEVMREIIAGRDRAQAGATAPPHGLYLVKVEYPGTPAGAER